MNGPPRDDVDDLPKPGDVIAEGYTVLRVLGVGGMGAVLEAESEELGGRCALKIMLPSLTDDEEFKARFQREARISQLVESEHVVRVLDTGALPDGRLFMAMELLTGNDLADEIDARGALPIEESVGIVIQAIDALHEAHKQGIVHRDLKPANLFLADRGGGERVVKVLDFGISKKLATSLHDAGDGPSLTGTDSMLGSPKYMSPEQIRNAKAVDGRADIWSLGVILYKLLLDRHPYRGESLGEYVSVLAFEPPEPIAPNERSIPDALAEVILRCLEKKPEGRYRTVARLAADLARWAPPTVAHVLDRLRAAEPSAFPEPLRASKTEALGARPANTGGTVVEPTLARAAPAPRPPLGATVSEPRTVDPTLSDDGGARELRAALAGIRVSSTSAIVPEAVVARPVERRRRLAWVVLAVVLAAAVAFGLLFLR